jgi:hypothetical protein
MNHFARVHRRRWLLHKTASDYSSENSLYRFLPEGTDFRKVQIESQSKGDIDIRILRNRPLKFSSPNSNGVAKSTAMEERLR